MLSGQLIKDYWEYNVNLVRNAGYALADSVPGQYVYYDFAYGIGEISWKEKIEGHISVIQDTWDALADEATYVCSSPNRTQSFTYGANCELPLSFIKPVTGPIEAFDAAYEGEDTATQAIENVYASYDQKMMDAAAFSVDERAYNDGKVPADIAGGIMMGILLDQLTSGMSFFSASPVDELADCALSTTRSELAGSAEGAGENIYSPVNPHPTLPKYVQNSFSGGTFTEKVLTEDATFYRVYSDVVNKVGSYMSRTPQYGGMQSQLDLALNPDWGNTATYVTKVTVPKGTVIYEGTAAPQVINGGAGVLNGGGNQVFIPKGELNSLWFGN